MTTHSSKGVQSMLDKYPKKRQNGEQEVAEDTKIPTDDPGISEVEREKCYILPSKEKLNLSSMVRSVKMKLK
ncbi:hypothetical protein F3Y22_tig00116962pilonHSYRG00390 [Hibiscus syriacus]|uniref:Uncharacterized protein n=1 Tax=Hibiscus syriacus TaxID=106335 RepID=A0A6A2WVZ6_HIBSY|nr:hypothetical protein F3Y22_tig00116962pilonHSYRG00390 [Hibiscus syriacus]